MKTKSIIAVAAVLSLMACNRMDLPINQEPDFSEGQEAELEIKVKAGAITKGLITGTFFPIGSRIGIFLTDDSGVSYEGKTYQNKPYVSNETINNQGFIIDELIPLDGNHAKLGTTNGTVYSYYPYDSSNNDVTAIPIEATSFVQEDYMWGTPVSGLHSKNPSAAITMNHALAAVRLKLSKGSYTGLGNCELLRMVSESAAQSAILDATNGSLSSISLAGQPFYHELNNSSINDGLNIEFMVVPTGASAPITLDLLLDGTTYSAELPAVTLKSGKIYEYNLTIGTEKLVIQNIAVDEWDTFSTEELFGYESVQASPNIADIYNNAIPDLIPMEGVAGTEIALIMDKNYYIYYSPEEWLACKEAGIVTNDDALGVLVTNSLFFACFHIIHPKKSPSTLSWSSSQSPIPGVKSYETTVELLSPYFKNFMPPELDIENLLLGKLEIQEIQEIQKILEFLGLPDMESFLPILQQLSTMVFAAELNGKGNTEAILAAVADGTIPDAPAAEYCANVTFANGEQGYLPSSGQISAWLNNKDAINAALQAIGGDLLEENEIYWSSTQVYNDSAICFNANGSYQTLTNYDKRTNAEVYARPVINVPVLY